VNGQTAPPHAFIIRPDAKSESAEVKTLARLADARAQADGLRLTTLRTARLTMWEEGVGRKVDLLAPEDAHFLYDTLHRDEVLVLAFTRVYVRRNPQREPAARRAALALETFVQHKAIYGLVRATMHVGQYLEGFATWVAATPGCRGIDDPRCLPLHVFDTSEDWSRLGEPDADRAFVDRYGQPNSRHDEGQRLWARALHSHGGTMLRVSGCEIAAGQHWEVSVNRGSTSLHTSHEVWHLPSGKHDYLNVHPNEKVRLKSKNKCRKVWPR